MRGYVNIPASMHCKLCKDCGARPIIVPVEDIGYVVKCPTDNMHYQTMPGLIDIEDWNRHNTIDIPVPSYDYSLNQMIAW